MEIIMLLLQVLLGSWHGRSPSIQISRFCLGTSLMTVWELKHMLLTHNCLNKLVFHCKWWKTGSYPLFISLLVFLILSFVVLFLYFIGVFTFSLLFLDTRESEYAAWTLVNGYALNHATIATHRLESDIRNINKFNKFVEDNGFKLNSEGGILKGQLLISVPPRLYLVASVTFNFLCSVWLHKFWKSTLLGALQITTFSDTLISSIVWSCWSTHVFFGEISTHISKLQSRSLALATSWIINF